MDSGSLELRKKEGARDACYSLDNFLPGETLLIVPSLAAVVSPDQKGQRCDGCFTRGKLQRCSKCASYWYCSAPCQAMDWKLQHKKMCKQINQYTASSAYQALAAHEKMDALMLSHIAAQTLNPKSDSFKTAMDLLPSPNAVKAPPIAFPSTATLNELYARFGNNNFAIHSHFSTVGHGMFPLASRLFNHSCVPNAIATYEFDPGTPVRMRVSALRAIDADDEVCLTYLDPALLQTRQKIFEITYGFTCTCPSCEALNSHGQIPEPSPDALPDLSKQLTAFVKDNGTIETLPESLRPVLHESFLSNLSSQFSTTSHDGPYDQAIETGSVMLDLYSLIYPPNYPQTGLHLLEMAKTAWNMIVMTSDDSKEGLMQEYLDKAQELWEVIGQEGDDDGPLVEIEVLEVALRS